MIFIRFCKSCDYDTLKLSFLQAKGRSNMFYISDIQISKPAEFKTSLQKQTYHVLDQLKIKFERVDTDEAITMDDCILINEKLDMKMVKTLFLCNRKKTLFFLFVTTGNKVFHASAFSNAMGCSRVSFAPEDLMTEMLGTKIGAATVFSAINDLDGDIHIVIDQDVADEEYYGCSDGTTTCYLKIKTDDILNKFLPYAKHKPYIIQV